jgi:hypothetical protein
MALTKTQAQSFLDAARKQRKTLVDEPWRTNVNFRVQKPFGGATDEGAAQDRVAVPEDWARTRQKTAQLSFQVPKILASAKRPEFESAAPIVTAAINDKLQNECRASYVIDECLADVINAAGLMVAVVGIDIRSREVEVEIPNPSEIDPFTGQPVPSMLPPKTEKVTQIVSKQYYLRRVSPGAFLWPAEFTGSDWDQAPWLAYDTWLPAADIKRQWGEKIPKEWTGSSSSPLLLSRDVKEPPTTSTDDGDVPVEGVDGAKYGRVTTLWYRASCFDETEPHPDALRTMIFVDGVPDPVFHDNTDWQVWVDEQPGTPEGVGPDGQPTPATPPVPGHYLGLTKFPIRVGTLTYVSDLATPPSDSEAARPQVREMIRSRSQMIRQRDHSVPFRWYDVNRLDELTVARIQNGEWLDMIPVNGRGDGVIGEVARASYPRESFGFTNVIGSDLDRAWAMSGPSLGLAAGGDPSATEVNVTNNANAQRGDYEKARVSRFVAEVGEVLFSLMQRFMDETDYVTMVGADGAERLQPINASTLAGEYLFTFKADSSDRVDLTTKQNNLLKLYNLAANSPSLNRAAIEKDLVEVFGADPAKYVTQPKEKGPDPPNISYRFSGEDLLNPMAVAVMLKSNDIGPDDIKAAAMMIQDSIAQVQAAQPAGQTSGQPAAPGAVPPGQQPPDVEPPQPNEPILKRLGDGTRMMG